MFIQWSKRHWQFLICFSLIFMLLTACNDSDEPEIEGSFSNQAGDTADSDTDTTDNSENLSDAGSITPFAIDSLNGSLIFTQDQSLYAHELGTEAEPIEIATNIDPQAVFVSPDSSTLYYARRIDSHTIHIMAYNRANGEETIVAELSSQIVSTDYRFWRVGSWSPDGEWFHLVATGGGLRPLVVSKDGSTSIAIGRSVNNWVTWLSDGSGLIIRHFIEGIENRDVPFPEIQLVERLDTATQERTALDIDLASITSFADLETALNTLDYELAQSLVFVPPNLIPGFDFVSWRDPEFRSYLSYDHSSGTYTDAFRVDQTTFEGMFCTDWEIIQQSVADENNVDTLYMASNVALISDVLPVVDDGYVFLEWRYENCTGDNLPAIQLIHLASDGTTTVLGEEINVSEDNDVSDGLAHHAQRRIAVSPDGQFVAWIGGTPGNSQLIITNSASGESIVVRETQAATDLTEQFVGLGTVLWLVALP